MNKSELPWAFGLAMLSMMVVFLLFRAAGF